MAIGGDSDSLFDLPSSWHLPKIFGLNRGLNRHFHHRNSLVVAYGSAAIVCFWHKAESPSSMFAFGGKADMAISERDVCF
jgi:hypothetical protein